MTLMAGATLQHGKYTIQTVLEQNEWGITYQALQVDLAQIVVVQTLNLPELPASDLDQFLATVRQRLSPLPNPQVSVLECFIESNLLFIVLKHAEGGLDPDLRNWFSPVVNFLSPAPAPNSPASTANPLGLTGLNANNGHTASSPQQTVIQPVATTLQPPPSSAPPSSAPTSPQRMQRTTAQNGNLQHGTAPVSSPASGSLQTGQPTVQSTPQTKVTVLTAPPSTSAKQNKSKLWIPMSLGLTSIAAGLAGASFGWALRSHPANSPNNPNNPSLLSPILNNEQAFPPIEGWVGDDPVDLPTPLDLPEGSGRFNRRPSVGGRGSGQGAFSEDVPAVRSPRVPQAAVEEIPPVFDPLAPFPDPLTDSGADPSLYPPIEPTPEFTPIPSKIKPDSNPPATLQPPEPPPSTVQPPSVPQNVNGGLSTPGVQ